MSSAMRATDPFAPRVMTVVATPLAEKAMRARMQPFSVSGEISVSAWHSVSLTQRRSMD